MEISWIFGLIMFALLEVIKTQYEDSYGRLANRSIEYVALITSSFLLMYFCFPPELSDI